MQRKISRDVSLAYEKWAQRYDKDAKWNPAIRMEKGILIPLLDPRKSDAMLELGCGTGRLTIQISPKCKKIIGIDNSEEMLAIAKQKTQDFTNVNYLKLNVQKRKLPFQNNFFDKAVAPLLTNHIQNIQRLFGEVARVLKPGGIFVFDNPMPDSKPFKMAHPNELDKLFEKGKTVYVNHSLDEYVNSLHRSGFEIERVRFIRIDENLKKMLSERTYRLSKGHTFGYIFRARKDR
jgi:ubiquinone/menaquinone biosynthesis C-methylase UbiE